jgi:transcriptional regulator with XRE-family HTH domain
MSDNAFGLRLKELRQAAGLTQPALAVQAGLSKSAIADMEQGRYAPGWKTLHAVATALGVSLEAFLAAPSADVQPQGRGRPPKVEAPQVRAKGKKK